MTYTPRTGSVAARAIAHLSAVGIPVAARPLADAVDSEPDVLATSLVFALDEGMVVREKRDGLNWYRLGNPPAETEPTARRVVPVEPKAPPPVAEPPPAPPQPAAPIPPARDSQHVLKAEAARPDATARENPANASPVGGPMGARQPAAAGPPAPLPRVRAGTAPFRCGLFNDGEFVQEKGGVRLDRRAWWLAARSCLPALPHHPLDLYSRTVAVEVGL